ncbi:transposase [Burkholderia cepacia]|uniref:transposase n=1 Tax=Burkholderia cepacia TaxID=292 RepID=UPI001CF0FD3E|nr:transposase [Burkholderia cepacia]
MARLPRLDLPGIPQHVEQRGNNRLPCFLDDADRQRYLHLLRDELPHTGCLLHAYVLMDNHVHLLLTPPDTGMTARLMQKLGRKYVGHSMHDTNVPERCGKADISPAWSTAKAMSCAATGTSTSIRSVPV